MHFLDCLLRAPLRPIAIGIRIEVRRLDLAIANAATSSGSQAGAIDLSRGEGVGRSGRSPVEHRCVFELGIENFQECNAEEGRDGRQATTAQPGLDHERMCTTPDGLNKIAFSECRAIQFSSCLTCTTFAPHCGHQAPGIGWMRLPPWASRILCGPPRLGLTYPHSAVKTNRRCKAHMPIGAVGGRPYLSISPRPDL